MADNAGATTDTILTRSLQKIFYSFLIGVVAYFILKCMAKDKGPGVAEAEAEKYSLIIGAVALILMALYGTPRNLTSLG